MSDSLRPHGLQHTRLSCPSSAPRACSNSHPSSRGCPPTISSSVAPSPTAFNLSQHQGLFKGVSSSYRVARKYWGFSFDISPSNEHLGLISFRMDWLDLLAGQGTLKSLLQHHSSKASILWCSAFFTVQLSHPYMTTGKAIALTRRTFVGKVMSAFDYAVYSNGDTVRSERVINARGNRCGQKLTWTHWDGKPY